MKSATKPVPKVLLAVKEAVKASAAATWGKGSGGSYPWRKK